MTTAPDRLRTALDAAHQALIDSREGYAQAAQDAGPGDLRSLFEVILHEKRAAVERMAETLRRKGVAVEDDASLIGTLTRTIVWARSVITGEQSLLPGMIDGETRVRDALQGALDALPPSDPERANVAALVNEQESLIAVLERRRAA